MHAYRDDRVCANSLLVSQVVLETRLLEGLQSQVLNPEVFGYALKKFEEQLLKATNNRTFETRTLEMKVAEIERKIGNCTVAIAEGHAYKSLLDQIGLLEHEMQQVKARLENMRPETVRIQARDTRRFVDASLRNIRELLNSEPRLARAQLAKHIQKITLKRHGRGYIAEGNWKLLGLGCYDGAGGPDCTVRSVSFCLSVAA